MRSHAMQALIHDCQVALIRCPALSVYGRPMCLHLATGGVILTLQSSDWYPVTLKSRGEDDFILPMQITSL